MAEPTPQNQTQPQTGTPGPYTAAAQSLRRTTGQAYDVVNDYIWTLSRNRDVLNEVPYIVLQEYEINESIISQQISFYVTAINNASDRNTEPLSPYYGLYPRSGTGNWYKFPYFSDVNFEIDTPVWQTLDAVEAGKKATAGLAGVLKGGGAAQGVETIIDIIGGAYALGLGTQYPKVGIMDRPRLFDRHEFRSIEIKFPLFNTLGPDDWKRNRNLCWTLINQNLFSKRDFITGIPPVYYEVLVPGQHYSYASCVTNVTVYNRGNMRNLKDSTNDNAPVMVPDVYEVNMTLTDLVMPSRNLFQAIDYKYNQLRVNSRPSEVEAGVRVGPEISRGINALQSAAERAGIIPTSPPAPPQTP